MVLVWLIVGLAILQALRDPASSCVAARLNETRRRVREQYAKDARRPAEEKVIENAA